MIKPKPPTEEATFIKISSKIGSGPNSPLIKIYNDYENTHLAMRATELSLEPREIENVLAKEELKEKLVEEKFENYLQVVIKNSLNAAKRSNEKNHADFKNGLIHLMAVTESEHLSKLLKTVLSAI
jgi:hypothetical protein